MALVSPFVETATATRARRRRARAGRSLHLDETHAAAAVRVELVVVAERRDADAVPRRGMDEQLALGRGGRLAVEGELDHSCLIVSRCPGDEMIPACSSLEIAQVAKLRPIADIAAEIGLEPDEVELYGSYKAKVGLSVLDRLAAKPEKLVCATAITPTKAGEGKTTTSVSLTQGLGKIGKRPVLCLREASLGPVFGIKGGAAGGGLRPGCADGGPQPPFHRRHPRDRRREQLLSAPLEAHLLHGNKLGIDPLTVSWRRCVDMNDRALRGVVIGLGGRANGYVRETGRHHRGFRGDGDHAVARDLPRPAAAIGRDHRRLHVGGRAGDRRAVAGGGRDDRPAQGRHQAESRADARGAAGLRALRPVREHRPRQQLARRRPWR